MNGNEVMNTIDKPLSMVKEEFVANIISDINDCGLPLFVVESILKELMLEISEAVKQQAEMERIQYEQMVKQQAEQSNADVEKNN